MAIPNVEPEKKVFSVSFEYKRNGKWFRTFDHRSVCIDAESAIRRWKGAGYGETRNFTVKEVVSK